MALIFDVKVIPSSGQNKWSLDKAGNLKCYLKSPPEKGKANKELVKFLAKILKYSQDKIEIIAGVTGPKKKIKIYATISYEKLLAVLIGQQSFLVC